MFDAIQQLRAQPLRHTAGDAEHGVAFHLALDLAEPADHALLGVVANRASVDEDYVGAVRLLNGFVARCSQLAEH